MRRIQSSFTDSTLTFDSTDGGRKVSRVRQLIDAIGIFAPVTLKTCIADRVPSIGQKKPVHVYQLIAEDTVESKAWVPFSGGRLFPDVILDRLLTFKRRRSIWFKRCVLRQK